jgi:hypothetical protein
LAGVGPLGHAFGAALVVDALLIMTWFCVVGSGASGAAETPRFGGSRNVQ